MSLYKQLWLVVCFLLLVVFGISLLISSLAAQRYLQDQLSIKNADNAAALAISLSQQGADPILMELTLSAQFDTGFYARILLEDPRGDVLLERVDNSRSTNSPNWLADVLPLRGEPGVASVQDGWRQVGTLRVESHARFAYDTLWDSLRNMTAAFLLVALGAGALGSVMLRQLLRPLDAVVDQASALGERRFLTLDAPRTRELRVLVNAMNALSERVRQMLHSEGERLRQWQQQHENDAISGLLGRERFTAELNSALDAEDSRAAGTLCVLRINGMNELNRQHGRGVVDAALAAAGAALNSLCASEDWAAGRLNGSDIALLAPGEDEPRRAAGMLQDRVATALAEHGLREHTTIPVACSRYTADDSWSALLRRLDTALPEPAQAATLNIVEANADSHSDLPLRAQLQAWQTELEQAFAQQRFSLHGFPVLDAQGRLLHREYLVRLERDGSLVNAGHFLPWIQRLQLGGALDQRVLELGFALATNSNETICLNVSGAALRDTHFMDALQSLANEQAEAARRLTLELEEAAIYRHLDSFRLLSAICHRHAIQVGMDRTGRHLAELGALHDMGLDYVKLDPAFSQQVENNEGNRNVVRALCTIVHAIGCTVVATGVNRDQEREVLLQLGVDACTGPAVRD